jgi:hypothetical protein
MPEAGALTVVRVDTPIDMAAETCVERLRVSVLD